MKLLRIASMYFEPPPTGWSSWEFKFGDITVSTIPVGTAPPIEGKLRLIVKAEILIQALKEDGEGFINIPEKERRQCEETLETVANIISVFCRCGRSISSPFPCVALIIDDPKEREHLDKTRGFRTMRSLNIGHHFQIPQSNNLISGLQDRLGGVALLAEAFSHKMQSGRFHDFVRFFEAAFALSFNQVQKKLLQFLNPVYGYTKEEIADWVRMRHPLTHADGKKTDFIFLDTDVRQLTWRMEQAALDVLFNKGKWHDPSRTRRQVWVPIAATTSAKGDLMIRQGSELSTKFQLLDDFGVFPMDLQSVIQTPPESWWFKFENVNPEEQTNQVMK
ncbi:MAG: hypothetical protein P8168_04670 [Deltaproteobacteria bacterium]|jgi:hypothetical protein